MLTLLFFVTERCSDFILTFEDPSMNEDNLHQKKKYMRIMVSLSIFGSEMSLTNYSF